MSIFIGTNKPTKIYVGTTAVKKVYVGTQLVWALDETGYWNEATTSQVFGSKFQLDFKVAAVKKDYANNKVRIRVTCYLSSNGYDMYSSKQKTATIKIGGVSATPDQTYTATVARGQKNVYLFSAEADVTGKKTVQTVQIQVSVPIQITHDIVGWIEKVNHTFSYGSVPAIK